jgi:hypothetical protein
MEGWKILSFWKRVTWDSFVFILIFGLWSLTLVLKNMNLSSLELYISHCWFTVKCRIWFSTAYSWSQSFKITCGLFSNLRSVTKICFLLNWKSYHIIVANEMLIWKSIDFKLPHGRFQPFGPLIPQSVPIHIMPITEVSCDWGNLTQYSLSWSNLIQSYLRSIFKLTFINKEQMYFDTGETKKG